MTDFNASVTVNADGRLTLGSTAIVEKDGVTVASNEVPLLAPVGRVAVLAPREHLAAGGRLAGSPATPSTRTSATATSSTSTPSR